MGVIAHVEVLKHFCGIILAILEQFTSLLRSLCRVEHGIAVYKL